MPKIQADPDQLEKVFLNLFLNAIDAMPGGGMLSVSVTSDKISVADSGEGIDEADLPFVFDPFYSKKKKKGTGLGLAVVQQIVKDHGWEIEVQCVVGEWTEFKIMI